MEAFGHRLRHCVGEPAAAQGVVEGEDIFSPRVPAVPRADVMADIRDERALETGYVFFEKARFRFHEPAQRHLGPLHVACVVLYMERPFIRHVLPEYESAGALHGTHVYRRVAYIEVAVNAFPLEPRPVKIVRMSPAARAAEISLPRSGSFRLFWY